MKAALLTKTTTDNNLSDLFQINDIPIPEITSGQVLIKLNFASLNHRDLYIAQGKYSKIKLPVILGSDGCGTIEKIGDEVSNLKTGDEVVIDPAFNWGSSEDYQSKDFKILGMPDNGTLAEYISVNKSNVYKKPSHLDSSQAAALPLAGVTAFRALYKKADLKKDDSILITGIGGGVAAIAMTFALSTGANLYVTSGSDSKINKAVELGAKGGVNYKNGNWDKEILEISGNNIDFILDSSGGDTFSKAVEICNYGGRIVTYGASNGSADKVNLHRLYWKQLRVLGSTMGSPDDFAQMLEFVGKNKIVPVIDKIFQLENITDAFERMNHSEQFGKIVVGI